jgi:hypothetical protein
MPGVTLDLPPPNMVKPKLRFLVAPTPWRWYMPHCNVPSNLPGPSRPGIFCL